jgi:hypothetical protein
MAMIRAACLMLLIGCASASPASPPASIPEAWLVVAVYDDGTQVVRKDFATRAEAEQFVKRSGPEPGDNAPTLAIQKDSPGLQIRLDSVEISLPHHVTLRENWLKRNGSWTRALSPVGAPATVFTFRRGSSDDVACTRRGGNRAPLPPGAAWPVCCERRATYVGTLDFRARRESVPSDALTFHYCESCKSSKLVWIDAHARFQGTGDGDIGTACLVTDYPWDAKAEGMFQDRIDRRIAGPSPQLVVNVRGTKVGGHLSWIGEDETPTCGCGQKMRFIGQFAFAAGTAYFFHCCSDTRAVIQNY